MLYVCVQNNVFSEVTYLLLIYAISYGEHANILDRGVATLCSAIILTVHMHLLLLECKGSKTVELSLLVIFSVLGKQRILTRVSLFLIEN